MQNRQEWLRERKTYIGGSDIAAICSLSSFGKTPLDIYFSKVNEEIEEITKDNPNYEASYWGTQNEAAIARRYAEDHNVTVWAEPKVIRHKEYPFFAANIDRWVGDREYILECKAAHFLKGREWQEENTDEIPESYLYQVAWYCMICDVPKADIAVLIGGNDYREYSYIRNKESEKKLIKIAVNFWKNHVEKRIPPKCSNLSDVSNLFPIGNHKELTASENIAKKIEELKMVKEQETSLQKSINTLKIEIQEFMQDYDLLLDTKGSIVATWKNTSPRASFNLRQFKEDCQDIYLKYVNHAKQSRIFLIK